jgi:hypothetical protein
MMLIKHQIQQPAYAEQVRSEKRSEDMQKRLAYFLAVLAMATIALAPAKVSAG